jgi:hypothetical protein
VGIDIHPSSIKQAWFNSRPCSWRTLSSPDRCQFDGDARAKKQTPGGGASSNSPYATHNANSCQPSEAVSWLASDHPQCLRPDRFFRTSTVARGMHAGYPTRSCPVVQSSATAAVSQVGIPKPSWSEASRVALWNANAPVPATASSSLTPWLRACQDSLVAAESLPTASANRYRSEALPMFWNATSSAHPAAHGKLLSPCCETTTTTI